MISIVIPFYNSEKTAAESVNRVLQYRNEKYPNMEIVAVNDGSADNTEKVLRAYEKEGVIVVSYDINQGKGGALKKGVNVACGDVIIFTDGDLAYGIEPVEKFIEGVQSFDIAAGTRRNDADISKKYGIVRNIASNVFSFIVELLLHTGLNDTQCGFKAFKGAVAKELFAELETTGFAFDLEIIARARKKGMKITQIPIELITNDDENTSVRMLKDGFGMLRDIVQIRKKI